MSTEDVACGNIFSKQQIGNRLFDIQANDSPCNENTPGFCGHLVLVDLYLRFILHINLWKKLVDLRLF